MTENPASKLYVCHVYHVAAQDEIRNYIKCNTSCQKASGLVLILKTLIQYYFLKIPINFLFSLITNTSQ